MEKQVSIGKSMLFNTAGSLVYYACQWFMTVVIVRISGYEAAGVLAIAMTVTAAPAIVSLFNIRSYQVSDMEGKYSFSTYLHSRTYTNLLAFLICLIMVVIGGYTVEKSLVILFFMLFKVAEGYADVYYGMEQIHGRLDYAGISLAIRGAGTIAVFVLIMKIFDNMLLSMTAITAFSFLIIMVYDRPIVNKWISQKEVRISREAHKEAIKQLLITCVPLAVVAFLSNYSFNIAKVMLEKYYGSEVMGYYSSVASPTLVVQLAAQTIFAPLVPPLTEAYNSRNHDRFRNIFKQFFAVCGCLTLLFLIGAKLLAHWGLVLLFGESIEPYVYLFIPIACVMILMSVNACLFSVCTLLREINKQYIIGIAGMVVAVIAAFTIVKRYSVMGVVYAQALALTVQTVIQIIIILCKLKNTWTTPKAVL